jgi:hypothetical protein
VESDPWHSKEWDLLWLGSEKESKWPNNEPNLPQPYLIYQDPTTCEPKDEQGYVNEAFEQYGFGETRASGRPEGQARIIQLSRETFAAHAYAVSNSGATKLLYNNAHKGQLV